MANVLLINSNQFKQPWPVIPFGLCCIGSVLEADGHNVVFLDLCFIKNCRKAMAQVISRQRPDLIGISIRNIDNGVGFNSHFLLHDIKERIVIPCKQLYDGPIVIGGPAVSINPSEILSYLDLQYAVCGDGEECICEIAKRIDRGEKLEQTKGLVTYPQGELDQATMPWRVKRLDSLGPVHPFKYVDIKKYARYNSPLQVQTKRGCALECSYCTYNKIEGHQYRLNKPEIIADIIEQQYNLTGLNFFEFTDSTFNIPLDHAKSVLRAIIAKDLKLRLRTMGLNPSAIDEELVVLMKQAGFVEVDLGVESGSDLVLQQLGKNFTKSDVVRAVKILHKHKIPIIWYLLLGGPGESESTLRETFEFVTSTAAFWDLVNIGVGLRVYKGSPIAKKIAAEKSQVPSDQFLFPYLYRPDAIDVNQVKYLTKQTALTHPNFYMYDEDERTPLVMLWIATKICRLFGTPVWRFHILFRALQKRLGILFLRRLLHSYRRPSTLIQ